MYPYFTSQQTKIKLLNARYFIQGHCVRGQQWLAEVVVVLGTLRVHPQIHHHRQDMPGARREFLSRARQGDPQHLHTGGKNGTTCFHLCVDVFFGELIVAKSKKMSKSGYESFQ